MRRAVVILAVGAALLALGQPAFALEESAAWGQVPSPNVGTLENELAGLAAVGPNDIWAVGRYNTGRPPTVTGRDTLALHWNGTVWSPVTTPNATWAGADFFTLEDADAVSANQVWAVGYAEDFASLKSTTLIERWNGSTWSIVPSPNPAGSNRPNELFAVAASGSNVVWAVGEAGYPEEKALVLRFNGNRWRAVPNGCGTALYGLDVVSANDVWAVGPNTTCHFDGSAWAIVPSPQPRGQFNEVEYALKDLSAVGPNDVWASGYRVIDAGEYYEYASIVEHWDGKAWSLTTIVPGHQLTGIEALAPDDVWAVGTDATRGVVAHFDGTGWDLVPSPTPGDSGVLTDLEAQSSDHLWAVGTSLGKSLVLESPSRFEGTVVGETGVAFATVSWFGPESGSVQTDAGGGFAAPGLAAGTYQLFATNPGCSPAQANVTVVAGKTVNKNLPIQC